MTSQKAGRGKDFWIFVGTCVGIMMIGIVALYLNQLGIGINLILFGILAIVIAVLLGKEHFFRDECTKRINEKAASKAYVVTVLTMLLLLAFGKTIPIVSGASFNNIVGIIGMPGLFCLLVFTWYYRRKGDV